MRCSQVMEAFWLTSSSHSERSLSNSFWPTCSYYTRSTVARSRRGRKFVLSSGTTPHICERERGENDTVPLEYAGSVVFALKMLGAHRKRKHIITTCDFSPGRLINIARASTPRSHVCFVKRPCPLQQVAVSNLRASHVRPVAYLAQH